MEITLWTPGDASELSALAEILHACVHAGASVSFILPFTLDDALGFWRDSVAPRIAAGTRFAFVARLDGRIVGTAQLDIGTPPNQPHRADVMKVLVHPDVRRRGIARALMVAVESLAMKKSRTLLTLDTVTGGDAEPLYVALGYVAVGHIPGYALNFDSSSIESTTLFYKRLEGPAGVAEPPKFVK